MGKRLSWPVIPGAAIMVIPPRIGLTTGCPGDRCICDRQITNGLLNPTPPFFHPRSRPWVIDSVENTAPILGTLNVLVVGNPCHDAIPDDQVGNVAIDARCKRPTSFHPRFALRIINLVMNNILSPSILHPCFHIPQWWPKSRGRHYRAENQ